MILRFMESYLSFMLEWFNGALLHKTKWSDCNKLVYRQLKQLCPCSWDWNIGKDWFHQKVQFKDLFEFVYTAVKRKLWDSIHILRNMLKGRQIVSGMKKNKDSNYLCMYINGWHRGANGWWYGEWSSSSIEEGEYGVSSLEIITNGCNSLITTLWRW